MYKIQITIQNFTNIGITTSLDIGVLDFLFGYVVETKYIYLYRLGFDLYVAVLIMVIWPILPLLMFRLNATLNRWNGEKSLLVGMVASNLSIYT